MTKLKMKKWLALLCAVIAVGIVPAVWAEDDTPTPIPEAVAAADVNPYADIPFSRTVDGAPVLGNPDAPITIVEFADFACPHCQRYRATMQQFIDEFVVTGRAQYEFRHFPTAGGEMTAYVGNINSCFEDQQPGVFWPLHDAIYEQAVDEHYDTRMLRQLARRFDLSYRDALTCMSENEGELQTDIDRDLAYSLDVGGTPAIRVRYKDHNNGLAQYLVVDGIAWDQGGAPLELLAIVVEDAEAGNIPDPDIKPETPLLIPGDPL